MLPFGLFD